MSQQKIPPKLTEYVFNLLADGFSYKQISEQLLETHQISITSPNVRNFIFKLKEERKAVAKVLYAEKLAETVGNDVKIVTDRINSFDALSKALIEEGRIAEGNALAKTVLEYIKFKSFYSNDVPDGKSNEYADLLKQTLSKMTPQTTYTANKLPNDENN